MGSAIGAVSFFAHSLANCQRPRRTLRLTEGKTPRSVRLMSVRKPVKTLRFEARLSRRDLRRLDSLARYFELDRAALLRRLVAEKCEELDLISR